MSPCSAVAGGPKTHHDHHAGNSRPLRDTFRLHPTWSSVCLATFRSLLWLQSLKGPVRLVHLRPSVSAACRCLLRCIVLGFDWQTLVPREPSTEDCAFTKYISGIYPLLFSDRPLSPTRTHLFSLLEKKTPAPTGQIPQSSLHQSLSNGGVRVVLKLALSSFCRIS